jgi:hypothetical protein
VIDLIRHQPQPAEKRTLTGLLLCGTLLSVLVVPLFGSGGMVMADVSADAVGFELRPRELSLVGNFSRLQLVVRRTDATGQTTDQSEDLTHESHFRSSDPQVVSVSESGRLLAVGNGQAEITVTVNETSKPFPVSVSGVETEPRVTFENAVLPVLSKAGCNMGSCHASQHGKGGFKLSVFGFQPRPDRDAIVRDRRGRRVNFLDPQTSLLLQKPTLQVRHGGGRRLDIDSVDHKILETWIRTGAPPPQAKTPTPTDLVVMPARRVARIGQKQQLRVEAIFSDGTSRDVTAWAKFDSMDKGLLDVSPNGLVSVTGRGQAPVMVRFAGHARISMFVSPYSDSVELAGWRVNNFVDRLAEEKFRELGIDPSPLSDDATFVRRAFLDAIGTVPPLIETVAFLNSNDPDKRQKLIDRLLGLTGDDQLDVFNDQYAAYWTLRWSDLIRNRSVKVGEQGMWALHNWLKESFRNNKPFDRFVSELVTAKGSIFMNGPANYFRLNANASDLTESTSQLFMGIRLQCAKCHHHPFEKYSQADYQGFSKFFSRVTSKRSQEFGLFGRDQVVLARATEGAKATPLGGEAVEHPLDLRIALADWLTSPENDYFAKAVVNRYVAFLLGQGLVEPVDDLRETNPPSNVALMDALAKDFTESGYNLKHLMRTIMESRLYQLDSQPIEANVADRRYYSHFEVKRISAEPLLDAIDIATGVPTKFKNLPLGTRAVELPDAEYPNYFLKTFGKPVRASVCECERVPDENLAQALHTLNGDILAKKIEHKTGRLAKLLEASAAHDEIVGELYLVTLSRNPTEPERVECQRILDESPSPKEAYEDLLWALINSKQFLFIR